VSEPGIPAQDGGVPALKKQKKPNRLSVTKEGERACGGYPEIIGGGNDGMDNRRKAISFLDRYGIAYPPILLLLLLCMTDFPHAVTKGCVAC
jgi:hypothetical protein